MEPTAHSSVITADDQSAVVQSCCCALIRYRRQTVSVASDTFATSTVTPPSSVTHA